MQKEAEENLTAMPDAALSYAAPCRDTEYRPDHLPAPAAGLIGRERAGEA